ncbi:unnamed protein product [Triticum turgidum subsp. durum]|uniref:PLAC8 family protein n=1 Tax=Triticum turgidum subsp. durum TaxID=4567 RepID=A0A9R0UWF8_TRITD|nr:unnamed protein product [Triticum turgidum subsp. durum]
MAASQEYMDKALLRRSYRNVWHTDLTNAIQADFPYCCLSLWCGPCVSYMLRRRALYHDMSSSLFFSLANPCVSVGVPDMCAAPGTCHAAAGAARANAQNYASQQSSDQPDFQAFLCFGSSVASTRFLLQDEFNIQTTQCDNCIISSMFCLQQLACICSLVACIVGNQELSEASQAISCVSDTVYWTVCSCMQTQHKVEMDKRDGKLGGAAMTVPPMQQMSRIDQPMPPQVGYAPQPASYR